jgi:acetyltransferase-like isoleucine patch superfamily enzyme
MGRPPFIPTRDYLCSQIISRIPFVSLRMQAYRVAGLKVGEGSVLLLNTEIQQVEDVTIGANTVINQRCYLDGRGGLSIGNNVNISSHVILVAGTHDIQNGTAFSGFVSRVVVEDYAWLCTRCIVLPGVTIGRGSVVAAGAVVTRSTEPFSVCAGVPARKIGERNRDLNYKLSYDISWV